MRVSQSPYEKAVNILNDLTPQQDRIITEALDDLIRQRDTARAEAAALREEVEAMRAVVEKAHAINERLQEAKDEPYEDGWRTIFKHGGYNLVGRFADALDALRARKVGG